MFPDDIPLTVDGDPDYAVLGLPGDGKIMKPIDGLAQFGSETIDGLDGMNLVQLQDQAA